MSSSTPSSTPISKAYSILVGLAALTVLLQGVWAGLFIREGQDNDSSWVTVHARAADLAIVLALAALVVGILRVRHRRDLVVGTGIFALLLIVEAFLGGLIGDHGRVAAVHIPLAMGLLGLAVWLPMRARTPAGDRTRRP